MSDVGGRDLFLILPSACSRASCASALGGVRAALSTEDEEDEEKCLHANYLGCRVALISVFL
jgi:hypothetical protein